MAHAICRGCGAEGDIASVTKKVNKGYGNPVQGIIAYGVYDQCRKCSSIDIDVLSPEGHAHEIALGTKLGEEVAS